LFYHFCDGREEEYASKGLSLSTSMQVSHKTI
jgi:hypothetical protein